MTLKNIAKPSISPVRRHEALLSAFRILDLLKANTADAALRKNGRAKNALKNILLKSENLC